MMRLPKAFKDKKLFKHAETSWSPTVILLLRFFCFWFFVGLRCGVWLVFAILYRYKNEKYVKIDI